MDPVTRSLLQEFLHQNQLSHLPEDKAFEHFCAYSVIARHFQDEFQTEDVVVGNGGDLGIDALAIIVNGNLVLDADEIADYVDRNGYLDIDFVFIQAKRSPNFDSAEMLRFFSIIRRAFFEEAMDLPRSETLANAISIKQHIFERATTFRKGNPICYAYYITTGRWTTDPYLSLFLATSVLTLKTSTSFDL